MTAIDATCGNGYDSLYVAEKILTPSCGHLHCVDIQKTAIDKTKKRLLDSLEVKLSNRVYFHLGCFTKLPKAIESPDFIIYNLGYLPGSDKKIQTTASLTIKSIQYASHILSDGGLICISCYLGHKQGYEEYLALNAHLQSFSSQNFNITKHSLINRELAPVLILIQKKHI